MHIWPLCLGMCFVSNVDLPVLVKGLQCPQCFCHSSQAVDTDSPPHSHKTFGIDVASFSIVNIVSEIFFAAKKTEESRSR